MFTVQSVTSTNIPAAGDEGRFANVTATPLRDEAAVFPRWSIWNLVTLPTCNNARYLLPEPIAVSVTVANMAVYPAVPDWFTVGNIPIQLKVPEDPAANGATCVPVAVTLKALPYTYNPPFIVIWLHPAIVKPPLPPVHTELFVP